MKENWKQWKDTKYEVSDLGNVRSNFKGDPFYLKPSLNHNGYLRVRVGKNKSLLVHRMVGFCFLEPVENKAHINHLNLNKTDNRVENLEWCNIQENNDHYQQNGTAYLAKVIVVINTKNEFIEEILGKVLAFSKYKKRRDFILIDKAVDSPELRLKLIDKRLNHKYVRTAPPSPDRRLNNDAVRLIRELSKRDGFYNERIASIFSVDRSIITNIISGKIYFDVKDIPE